MANQSWRSYGGTNKLDKMNYITTKNFISDNLTIKQAYVGNFDISGSMQVSGSALIGQDTTMQQDAYIYGNASITKNIQIGGNIDILGNLNLQSAMIIQGDTHFDKNLNISGQLSVVGRTTLNDTLYLGGGTTPSYLYGINSEIGLNTKTPTATFDIVGSNPTSFNVHSLAATNTNVFARNNTQKGVVISSSDTVSAIQFFNDTQIQNPLLQSDAQIEYTKGGNLLLYALNNTNFTSKMAITTKRDNMGSLINRHLNNETVIIYDTSTNSPFLYNYYNKPAYNSGNALTLVSDNTESNTFLNIVNPNKQGIMVSGGSYPDNDFTRSMGMIGLSDNLGNYVPIQTIVSGNNSISQRATIGINKYNPITETYILDINGPVRIDNGEITNVVAPMYQVKSFASNRILSCLVGNNIINYSINGSKTWNSYTVVVADAMIKFTTCFVCKNSTYAIVGGENGYLYYTFNSGTTWVRIMGISNGSNNNINSIYSYTDATNLYIYISYNNSNNIITFYNTLTTLSNVGFIGSISPTIIITTTQHSYQILQLNTINSICGYDTIICIAGSDTGNNGNIIVKSTIDTSTPTSITTYSNPNTTYTSIKIINIGEFYYISAVGHNGVISWLKVQIIGALLTVINPLTTITKPGVYFNDVFMYTSLCAIAVGNASTLYYTIDGFTTWNPISYQLLNSSGIASLLTSPLNNFANVYMNDINSFVVSSISPDLSSNLYYCYLPNVFNHQHNKVLDICGNMQLSGSLTIDDNIYTDNIYGLATTNPVINIGNTDNSTINIGGNVNIGGNHNSLTVIGSLIGNTQINGTVYHSGPQNYEQSFLVLNKGKLTPSYGGGIYINDVNCPDLKGAYMIVSQDTDGFLFKTAVSPTVLKMSVQDISLSNVNTNIGLVALKRTKPIGSLLEVDSSYTMISYDIDVSNILLRDGSRSSGLLQSISTIVKINNTENSIDLSTGSLRNVGGASICGNMYIGGNLVMANNPIIVNKLAENVYPNMMMDINGNAAITRLGLNLNAINGNATLAIRGNIIQTGGFIQQF